MNQKQSDLVDVIGRWRRNFANGEPLFGAYFVTSDKVPMGTVVISKIDALKIAPHGIPAHARPAHDYAVTLHPVYLVELRAEFRRVLPENPLNDMEMALIIVGGSR